MGNEWEVFFTIAWLGIWLLFPLGLFLSVGSLDKNSDELEQLKAHPDVGDYHFSKIKKPLHFYQWREH